MIRHTQGVSGASRYPDGFRQFRKFQFPDVDRLKHSVSNGLCFARLQSKRLNDCGQSIDSYAGVSNASNRRGGSNTQEINGVLFGYAR